MLVLLRACHQEVISSLQNRWIDTGMLCLGVEPFPGVLPAVTTSRLLGLCSPRESVCVWRVCHHGKMWS